MAVEVAAPTTNATTSYYRDMVMTTQSVSVTPISLNTATVRSIGTIAPSANDEPVVMSFTRDAVKELVSDGKFFSVTFRKRTTNEMRTMQCRSGVVKHLKRGSKSYDDAEKGLLTVFSTDANGYRSVPIDAIERLVSHGVVYLNA